MGAHSFRPQQFAFGPRLIVYRVAATLLALTLVGCATTARPGICAQWEPLEPTPGNLHAEEHAAELAWHKRKDAKQLMIAIEHWRTAVTIAPEKTENYIKLSNALYLWADGPARFAKLYTAMAAAFRESTDVAEEALRIQNPAFRRAACSQAPFVYAVAKLRKADVPAVYSYASALGKYGLVESVLVVLEHQERISALLQRVEALAPRFHQGAVGRFLGAYYTRIPFPEGNLKKSRQYFEQSLAQAPDFVATRVLMAELLAPRLRDRQMFEEQLNAVLRAPVNIIPGMEPETLVEKRKAKDLMADIDVLFPPDPKVDDVGVKTSGWFDEAPTLADMSGAIKGHSLRLLRNGEDTDDVRWALLAEAKHSVYISAYAWKNDNVGLALVDAVCNRIAETRGKLEVKIILENFGSKELKTGVRKMLRSGDSLFASKFLQKGANKLLSCGASVVFYRPRRQDWRHLMQVRHEKLFIVDGKTLLTGGSNVGDHYHMASPRSGKWYDLDVLIKGPIACWYHNQFQRSWRHVVSQDIGLQFTGIGTPRRYGVFAIRDRDKRYGLDIMQTCDPGAVQVQGSARVYGVYGRPIENPQRPILRTYLKAIAEARHSIRLYAPYFVPVHAFAQALIGARKRGVKVTLITNSPESLDEDNMIFSAMLLSVFHSFKAGDEGVTHPGSLHGHGVTIQIWGRRATMHRKGGVFDAGHPNQKAFMGSDNLDVRGQEYSTESIVWTDDPKIISRLRHDFDMDTMTSKALTKEYRKTYLNKERSTFGGRVKLWVAEEFRAFF